MKQTIIFFKNIKNGKVHRSLCFQVSMSQLLHYPKATKGLKQSLQKFGKSKNDEWLCTIGQGRTVFWLLNSYSFKSAH